MTDWETGLGWHSKKSRMATFLWCVVVMCDLYCCLCRDLCLAIQHEERLVLWFFFWLYNPHSTAADIRSIRLLAHPVLSLFVSPFIFTSLFLFGLILRAPVSSFIHPKKTLVLHFSVYSCLSFQFLPFCLWWLRCKTQVGQTQVVESHMD